MWGLSSTDPTSPRRPNLEDEARRVPIFGPRPIYDVEGNTDFTAPQIVQETQFIAPEKPVARRPLHGREDVVAIPESPVSFLFRYIEPKKETSTEDMKTCEEEKETSAKYLEKMLVATNQIMAI